MRGKNRLVDTELEGLPEHTLQHVASARIRLLLQKVQLTATEEIQRDCRDGYIGRTHRTTYPKAHDTLFRTILYI